MYNHVQCSLVIVSLEGIIFSEITNLILIKSVYFRVHVVHTYISFSIFLENTMPTI